MTNRVKQWLAAGLSVAGLASALAGLASAEPNQAPKPGNAGKDVSSYHANFENSQFDWKSLVPLGPSTLYGWQLLKPEPRGLRIVIPYHQSDPKSPFGLKSTLGFAPLYTLEGDFEVTAAYELLAAESFKDGIGPPGADLYLLAEKTLQGVTFRRCVDRQRKPVYLTINADTGKDGKRDFQWRFFPAQQRAGSLQLKRSGSTLQFLASEGVNGPFRKLHEVPCTTNRIGLVRVAAITDGNHSTVEVLWKGLTLHAQRLVPVDLPLLKTR